MSVLIEQDITGRLILDLSQEQALLENPDFNDVILAFPIVSRTPVRLILDLSGQIATSVGYIRSCLEALHIEVVLIAGNWSHCLRDIMQSWSKLMK